MSFENETQDFMRKFFDDTINSFKEESAPLIKQFIESHRAVLSGYRDCLDELLQQDPSSQAEVKLTTMFLEMSLKMMQLQRESRKRFLTIQSKIPSSVEEGTDPSPTLKLPKDIGVIIIRAAFLAVIAEKLRRFVFARK